MATRNARLGQPSRIAFLFFAILRTSLHNGIAANFLGNKVGRKQQCNADDRLGDINSRGIGIVHQFDALLVGVQFERFDLVVDQCVLEQEVLIHAVGNDVCYTKQQQNDHRGHDAGKGDMNSAPEVTGTVDGGSFIKLLVNTFKIQVD